MRKVLPLLAVVLGVLTTAFMIRLKISQLSYGEDLITYQNASLDFSFSSKNIVEKDIDESKQKSFDTSKAFDGVNKEGTEITFSKDVIVNGNKLTAGKYILYAIPNQQNWLVLFNKENNQWGAVRYGKKIDLLQKETLNKALPEPLEILKIEAEESPDNFGIILKWENMVVMVPSDMDV